MITSGCTGWEPNKARLLTAGSILGEWKQLPNPCVGEKADKTFGGQGTYILPLQGKEDRFVFMADSWRPESLSDSRYIWLPIQFNEKEYLLLNGLIGGNLINFVYITVPV